AVLINEAAAKYMGLANPVGVLLKDTDEENPDPPLTIIGVVEDMIMQSPYEPVKQGIFAYDSFEESAYYNLRLNPGNSASENLSIIENVFMKHFPDLPFQYQFVDQQYERKFRSEVRIGKLASIFTALAILISCLGLFGLTSFVAEQRTKEIGVRKVLGASVFTVWKMLSKDFIALVVFSCIIAIPISYYVMNAWLDGYTYRVSLSWWIFAAAIIGAIIITLLTVSFQALKAAKANPVNSLRTE
ncbi:ABC transporter permease, partial [Eudoraea sp.]